MDSYSYPKVRAVIQPRVMTVQCPHKTCHWFRAYTDSGRWLDSYVTHPLYGPIKQAALVQLELKTHDCIETHNARVRLGRNRAAHS